MHLSRDFLSLHTVTELEPLSFALKLLRGILKPRKKVWHAGYENNQIADQAS